MPRFLLLLGPLVLLACPSTGPLDDDDSAGEPGLDDDDAGDDDDAAPTCAPVQALSCGQSILADTSDPNDGATSVLDGYPVAVGNYSGPEIVYSFTAPAAQQVWWGLVGARPTELDQDVFVLDGAAGCSAEAALQRGFNSLVFSAAAGATYYLVVDGYAGQAGAFVASLDCGEPGDLPPEDPGVEVYDDCAFGQNTSQLLAAPHLTVTDVANYLEPGQVPALVADQMLDGVAYEGWASVSTIGELWDYVDADGVYLKRIVLETSGEAFDWIRWYAGDTEVGYIYTEGSMQRVAMVGDQDINECSVVVVP
jgi:hypothetical protein